MPPRTALCELALKYQTDKGGEHTHAGETCHNYTPAYFKMWDGRQQFVQHVLEIGVNYGCSLRMWRDFFPHAVIWGIDSNAGSLFQEERIRCVAADQGREDSLFAALQEINRMNGSEVRFDFIVDDGSHERHHQILSARTLIPYLTPDGIYVIEDIALDCQPEFYLDAIVRPEGGKYPSIAIDVGVGIGKAHCADECPKCHGKEGERLLVLSQ